MALSVWDPVSHGGIDKAEPLQVLGRPSLDWRSQMQIRRQVQRGIESNPWRWSGPSLDQIEARQGVGPVHA